MIIDQIVISALIHRPVIVPKLLNCHDFCASPSAELCAGPIIGDIPRPGLLPMDILQSPSFITAIFNRVRQFRSSSAPSP
jgi:hypothetical protein